jgi:type I restriction enzyme R subunit
MPWWPKASADVFALAGLDKPNIGLLSDEFLDDLRKTEASATSPWSCWKSCCATRSKPTPHERGAGEEVWRPPAGELRKYNNRAIETAQVIEEMIQMAKDFAEELAA